MASRKRDHVVRHTKNVHLERRPWTCGSCGNIFESNEGLLKHVQDVHGRTELMSEESRFGTNLQWRQPFFAYLHELKFLLRIHLLGGTSSNPRKMWMALSNVIFAPM